MASIRKRGNTYFIDYRVNGKRVRRSVGPSLAEAKRIQRQIKTLLATSVQKASIKGDQLRSIYDRFKDYSQQSHSPNTQLRYNSIITNFQRFLDNHFPNIKFASELDLSIVQRFIAARTTEGATAHTINAELAVLKKIFRLAIKWKFTSENPFEDINPLQTPEKKLPKILTNKECKNLFKACSEWLYPIVFTFLNTGLRKSELENLKWADIEFDKRIIHVVAHNQWTPKENERYIPINNELFAVLLYQKKITGDGELVFVDEKGKPIDKNKIRLRLIEAAKHMGLTDFTKVITLRHTFIHKLVEKGVDLAVIKKIVGHSDFNTVLAYKKYQEKHIQEAVEELDLD